MALSHVGTVTASSQNGDDITVDLSGLSLLEGDTVFVFPAVSQDNESLGVDISVSTSGYTSTAAQTESAFGSDEAAEALVAWKRMGATPDSQVVITASGDGHDGNACVATAWRDVDETNAFDATPTWFAARNSNQPDSPSITSVTDGCVILTGALMGAGNTMSEQTPTAPTGYTLLGYVFGSDSNKASAAVSWKSQVSAGAEDPAAYTGHDTGDGRQAWFGVTVAIRPAGAASGFKGGGASWHDIGNPEWGVGRQRILSERCSR